MRYKEKEVEDQGVKLSILEKEHKALVDRTKHLNEQVENRVVSIDKTNARLEDTHRHIGDLQGSINGLDVEINEVERQNDRHVENQKKMLRHKDAEIVRGQDLSHNSKHLEAAVKDADVQIDMLKRDLEGVRYGNDALLDRNHELKEEIDSLTQHSELLTS